MKCYYCKKSGHIKKECRKYKKEQKKEKGKETSEAKEAATVTTEGGCCAFYL